MYYFTLPFKRRDVRHYPGERPMLSFEPNEQFRAWAYDNGIRYVLRTAQWEVSPSKTGFSIWIGFYNVDDAFTYRMRWE